MSVCAVGVRSFVRVPLPHSCVHLLIYVCIFLGHRCLDTAESCKFSHDHLSDVTRNILLKHLEGAPKEILGDFPRLTREAAQTLVFQTEAKNKGWVSHMHM